MQHLETWYNRKHILISDDLSVYFFHIQIKIPKAVKITRVKIEIVRSDLACCSPQSLGEGLTRQIFGTLAWCKYEQHLFFTHTEFLPLPLVCINELPITATQKDGKHNG